MIVYSPSTDLIRSINQFIHSIHQSIRLGVYTIETPDGLVMIDGGTPAQAPLALKAIRRYTKLPLHTAIYTHGHLDHVWGPEQFEAEPGRDPSKRITVGSLNIDAATSN